MKPTHLDLFSGIGGFSLAFEEEGFETIGFSEIDPYACAVLNKHWPTVKNYGDVRNITKEIGKVDVVTGGFPCQPFSVAGERCGTGDERFLWPECVRIMRELRPSYALFENVTGLLTIDGGRTFNRILSDIYSVGYDCLWNCVPACAVGANHRRDRIWIMAINTMREHGEGCGALRGIHQRKNAVPTGICEDVSNSKRVRELQPQGSEQDERGRIGDGSSKLSYSTSAGLEGAQREKLQGNGNRLTDSGSNVSDTNGAQLERRRLSFGTPSEHTDTRVGGWWETEPELDRVAHGISNRSHRLKCLGNGIVPKVAQIFAKEIYKNLKTYHG